MEKEELLKQLELLADSCMSNYALESNGYNRGVLDALDLVNKYFALSHVSNNEVAVCSNCKIEGILFNAKYCPNCGSIEQTDC